VSRPSEARVAEALEFVAHAMASDARLSATEQRIVLRTLRAAVKPRPVWPAKEVAAFLGVKPEQLRPGGMRNFDKFPVPAQELPRPTGALPGKKMRLWFVDQVEDFKRDYMRGGRNDG
jgi:hypothetical protein